MIAMDIMVAMVFMVLHGLLEQTGQTGHMGQTGQTSQRRQTGQTNLTFKLKVQSNLCMAAFTILAMFVFFPFTKPPGSVSFSILFLPLAR